jgi:hypothetical protein
MACKSTGYSASRLPGVKAGAPLKRPGEVVHHINHDVSPVLKPGLR